MRDYVSNEELLCFTQDTIEKDNILVIEKSKRLTFKGNSLKFLRRCCFCYGHSYNIQRQFVIDHFNYYIKKINLIPFKTIIGYVLSISNFKLFLYNIVGNLVALIPLSIIILLKDEKNKSIKKQFLFLSISSFMIEFFNYYLVLVVLI